MRALTPDEEARYLAGREIAQRMGIPELTRETWLQINEGVESILNSMRSDNQPDESFKVTEREEEMVSITMSKKDMFKFEDMMQEHNIKQELMSDEIGLGDTVKDPVSGFQGVVTGMAQYLGGYEQIEVTRVSDIKELWFNVDRLEKV